jgi:hypothetical protein
MDIPEEYVVETCKRGQGAECCRYLLVGWNEDTKGTEWQCGKHTPLRSYLDGKVNNNTMNSKGDNCPGWDVVSDEPVDASSV